MLFKLYEAFAKRKLSAQQVISQLTSRDFRLFWLSAAMIVLAMATIFISLTRGGSISLLIAAALTALVISVKGSFQGRNVLICTMGLASFGCILYLGFDAVYDRLAILRELHDAEGGRWQIAKDIALVWTQFPLFGTGLGTHEMVYPMFDRAPISSLAAHADTEYASIIY